MEKVDNIQKQISKFSRDMDTLKKKNQKTMLGLPWWCSGWESAC